jgi:hypothetical protein
MSGFLSGFVGGGSISGRLANGTMVEIDFGSMPEGDVATSQVVSQTWISAEHTLVASFFGATLDHDMEDAAIEGLTVLIANIVPGNGFDVVASAPNGTWGKYNVMVMGV